MANRGKNVARERKRRAKAWEDWGGRKRAVVRDLFTPRRGGARKGAGRKPNGNQAEVPHDLREPFEARFPVHVTMRRADGLPRLRRKEEYRVLRRAIGAGCERLGLRLVEYVVMGDHLHLIVEAEDRSSLARGLAGIAIRCARALNRLWGRKGRVFPDRFHDRVLRTGREVRAALAYVLHNARRHGERIETIDGFSSGPWFGGWREAIEIVGAGPRWLATAGTWLLREGWLNWGRIGVLEVPGGR